MDEGDPSASSSQEEQQEEVVIEEVKYVPIAYRPEWADVVPLHPPPTPQPVVHIAMVKDAALLLAYFWAGVRADERSERMLHLSGEIILNLNSAHYTLWEWRWRCLEALGEVEERREEEAALMQRVAKANPKNYQLWNYRRRFALAFGPAHAAAEHQFTAELLAADAKNYHAWAHRQALVRAWGGRLWLQELTFAEQLLRKDVRNNSAWNQRMFVLQNAPEADAGPPSERHQEEMRYIATKLSEAPHNDSGWAYLRGLTKARGAPPAALAADKALQDVCMAALQQDESNVGALELLADVYAAKAALLQEHSGDGQQHAQAAAKAAKLAAALFQKLDVADPIRSSYSSLRRSQLAA